MKKNKTYKNDTTTLILLLIFSIGCLVLEVLISKNVIITGFLGLSILLLVSQLKKMNIKL